MGGAAASDHHPEEDAEQGAAGMAHRHAEGLPGVQRRMWQTPGHTPLWLNLAWTMPNRHS